MSSTIQSTTPQTIALAAQPIVRPAGRFRTFVRKNPGVVVPSVLLAVIVLAVLVLPFFLQSPIETHPAQRLLPPGTPGHPLGTDALGRDELSRLATGGRASLGMGVLITVVSGSIGAILGLISGFFPKAGGIIMRVSDAWMAFPAIVLAMIFSVVIGPGVLTELLAIGIIFIPFSARVLRSRTMEITSRTFVEAARVSGMGSWKTLFVHVFPNVAPLLIVQCIVYIAATMLIDGGLSFLGMGISPPAPSWGNMIAESRSYMQQAPHLLIFPGLILAFTVFLVNQLGTNLRPVFDPQTRALVELQRLRSRGNRFDRARRRV